MRKNSENIPRDELDYTNLYKTLDLDKKHLLIGEVITDDIPSYEFLPSTEDDLEEGDLGEGDIKKVDYCLDLDDMKYLESLNGESIDNLEGELDKLEKNWFFYKQDLLKKSVEILKSPDSGDSYCDICGSDSRKHKSLYKLGEIDSHPDDILLICQGCSITVHRDCYGSQSSQYDFFLCVGCSYYNIPSQCMFCPSEDGLLKLTSDLHWGHPNCVLFNDTLGFENEISKEPIDISQYNREEEECSYCETTTGTVVGCSFLLCRVKYHVSCALPYAYFDNANLVSYCAEHSPLNSTNILGSVYFYCIAGYKKLKEYPKIRRSMPLQKKKETVYMKIMRIKPTSSPSKSEESIKEYWIKKKEDFPNFLIEYLNRKYGDFIGGLHFL